MRTIFSFGILIIFSSSCFWQSNNVPALSSHRIFINPTQIITGEYTLNYSWQTRSKNFLEIGGGYQYFPVSSDHENPVRGGPYANPQYGLGYRGPIVNFSFVSYSKAYPLNNLRFEFTYKYLDHPYDCYVVGGASDYAQTFSGSKHVLIAKALWGKTIVNKNGKFLMEPYIGVGLRGWYGHEVTYHSLLPHEYDNLCIQGKPTFENSTQTITAFYTTYPLPSFHVGIRLGNQWGNK